MVCKMYDFTLQSMGHTNLIFPIYAAQNVQTHTVELVEYGLCVYVCVCGGGVGCRGTGGSLVTHCWAPLPPGHISSATSFTM